MKTDPPTPDLGTLPPLTPEERRQYCSRIVELDRPGLMRLVGRYEATVYAQTARLADAKTEIARLTAELAECWDQFEREQEYG